MNEDQQQASRLLFADLVLDTGKHEVSRGGEIIDLPKLTYQLIRILVEAAPNVVSHDEIINRVWSGRVVSPETVTQRVKLLRSALGDDAHDPRYVGVVRGEGYRLLVDVEDLPPDESSLTRDLVAELGRRRVLQIALIYAAVAWSITEVVSFLLDALPVFPQWSKALVAILFIVGFPVAMFLAWRFDIGPGGIKRTQAATTEGRLTIAAALLLMVGATASLFYLIYPSVLEQKTASRGAPAPNSIAVLPFAMTGKDRDALYLSEGLGDNLREQLGQVTGLQIAARTSSVIFRDQTVDAVGIAERLGVGKLVEGTLARRDDQLHITVQIIDGATGFNSWSASYDVAVDKLLAIQQEIATEVVRHVLPLLDDPQISSEPATLDASANDLMMLARHYYQQVRDDPVVVDLEILLKSIDLYRQATVADPDSALAHGRLGAALLYLGDVEGAEGPIFQAMSIDPDLSEVQYTLGLYYWLREIPGAGKAFQRAVELNPNNADAVEAYGKWVWHQPFGDAEQYLIKAMTLDSMSLARYIDLGNYYGLAGETEDALEVAQQIVERFPTTQGYQALARIHELNGDLDVAIAFALRAHKLSPQYQAARWNVAELYARIGDPEAAHYFEPEPAFNLLNWERRYDEMIDLGEDLVLEFPNEIQTWYGIARALVATGQFDRAIYVLRSQGLPENAYVETRRANGVEAMVTLADALKSSGETESYREVATWAETHFSDFRDTHSTKAWWSNLYLGCVLSILDKDELALQSLEHLLESQSIPWMPVLQDSPCFQKFANEQRYQAVLKHFENLKAGLRDRLPDTLAQYQSMQ